MSLTLDGILEWGKCILTMINDNHEENTFKYGPGNIF